MILNKTFPRSVSTFFVNYHREKGCKEEPTSSHCRLELSWNSWNYFYIRLIHNRKYRYSRCQTSTIPERCRKCTPSNLVIVKKSLSLCQFFLLAISRPLVFFISIKLKLCKLLLTYKAPLVVKTVLVKNLSQSRCLVCYFSSILNTE